MDELKELTAENNRLRAILARAGIVVLPLPDLPNINEADRLREIVARAYPALKFDDNERPAFLRAMHYFAFCYRKEKPNNDYALTYWIDTMKRFMADQGFYLNSAIALRPFVTAALAQGVAYGVLDEFPYAVNLGLSLGTRDPGAEWRDTLRRRALLPPFEAVLTHPKRVESWA